MTVTLTAPTGDLQLSLTMDAGGTLSYRLALGEHPIIEPSTLGFVLADADGGAFASGLELVSVDRHETREEWTNPLGERRTVTDHYVAADLLLRQPATGREAVLQARVYAAAAAFRWILRPSGQDGAQVTVAAETTRFHVPPGAQAWATYTAQGTYARVPLDQLRPGVERPLTLELANGCYASVTEAANAGFARMKLAPDPAEGDILLSHLDGPVTAPLPLEFPWRVVLAGRRPGDLLEANDVILNLSPPTPAADISWIRPGTVMRGMTLSTDSVRKDIDFAAEHGFSHVLLDTGWYGPEFDPASDPTTVAHGRFEKYPRSFYDAGGPLEGQPFGYIEVDLDLLAIVGHARERGCGVILYVNQLALDQVDLTEMFTKFRDWGVAGIKMGFVHVGEQRATRSVTDAVALAGRFGLVVNVHDEYRPTGLQRSLPHWLTAEGVAGDETTPPAAQDLALLFTRCLTGAADHTWNYFHPKLRGLKSPVFQLAAGAMFFSPLQHLFWAEDVVAGHHDHPGPGPDFWYDLPTVWDDTVVLDAAIGHHATIARRHEDSWWLGSLTADAPHHVEVDLSFLAEDRRFTATRYADEPAEEADAAWPTPVRRWTQTVTARDTLSFDLAPRSGHAVRLSPTGY